MSTTPIIYDQYNRPAALPAARAGLFNGGGFYPGGYEAAGWSRDRRYIYNGARDSSADITHFTRSQIDKSARWLTKNNGMVKGIKLDFIKYVVGPGIFPYADTGDEEIDEAYDDWFMDWAQICDLAGRMSFFDMQRAAEGGRFESGDVFTIKTRKPSGYPQLKFVRAHSVCSDGDDGYLDGVRVDRHGAPQRYKFAAKDGGFKSLRARFVNHSMMMEGGDEVRQVSALHAAILHAQDVLETLGFEKLAQKDHARISRVITKEAAAADWGDGDDGRSIEQQLSDQANGTPRDMSSIPYEQVAGSEIIRLQLGEKMQSFASDRPGQNFMSFCEFLGREIYTSTGWRFEFSWNPASVPGTAMRQILDSISRTAQMRQQCEIRRTRDLRNYAIASAIEMGALPWHPNWYRAEYFAGAPDPSIDKGRDGKLELAQIEAKVLSKKEYHARRGQNWRKVEDQILREAERANARGLDPEEAAAA